jgi:hypothetical protein
MKVYRFREEMVRGQAAEARVARWLTGCGYGVEVVDDRDRQLLGIDLVVTPPRPPSYTVEVKGDCEGGLGWLATCRADWLLYLAVSTGHAYWLRPRALYEAFWWWWRRSDIPKRSVRNASGYRTWGLCVPLAEVAVVATSEAVVPE